jgi:hypothetical protein
MANITFIIFLQKGAVFIMQKFILFIFLAVIVIAAVNSSANTAESETATPSSLTVTYVTAGNTTGTLPADGALYSQGDKVAISGNTGNLARAGFVFVGWHVRYVDDNGKIIEETLPLNYTWVGGSGGGGGISDDGSSGWASSGGGGVSYRLNSLYVHDELIIKHHAHVVFVAHWLPEPPNGEFYVIFNSMDVEWLFPFRQITRTRNGTPVGGGVSPRPGKEFVGWFTEPVGGTEVTGMFYHVFTEHTTLYARGKDVTYTFTLNLNYSGAPAPITVTTIPGTGDINWDEIAPTRDGYVLVGWCATPYTDGNCSTIGGVKRCQNPVRCPYDRSGDDLLTSRLGGYSQDTTFHAQWHKPDTICANNHSWGNPWFNYQWIVSKPATETETGEEYRDCLVCGFRETKIIHIFTGGGPSGGGHSGGGSRTQVEQTPAEQTTKPPEIPASPEKPHEFTTADALNILRHVAGLIELTPDQKKLYDFGGSGKITTNDALHVLRKVAGIN